MIHALGSIKRKKVLFLTNSYELYHHGVKGMKWGVRKTKETGVGIYRRSIGLPGSKDEAIKNKGMNPAKRIVTAAVGAHARSQGLSTKPLQQKTSQQDKPPKYNSFFGTSNIEVGKGIALGLLGTGFANIGIRTLLNNTDLGIAYNPVLNGLAANVVSGMIGGSIGGLYIRNHQYDQ